MYSFSQNFEDVYIYRAFRGITDGFYIDAGAFDPVVDSVTKMLYDLGWSGINLEPGPSFPRFASRVRDINLPYALTATEGETLFHYNQADPGTSTTAQSNVPADTSGVATYNVNSKTLAAIVRDHAPDRHIHFLKLDIEGSEWDVLQSTDWNAIRPELILVESSLPYSNERRDQGWAAHMSGFGYHEVFFDGVNTYYLREESLDRRHAFDFPVNVLDGIRKFDPYQHYSVSEDQDSNLAKSISEEVMRVVETESSTVREYLERDFGPQLQAQKDLVAKLTADQSEHFLRLKTLTDELPRADHQRTGGGNSIEAVIDQLAEGVSKLLEERKRQAADVALAYEKAEEAQVALKEREKVLEEVREQVRVLGKRLSKARASRLTMLQLTERVANGLNGVVVAGSTLPTTTNERVQTVGDGAAEKSRSSLAQRIADARRVPPWRKLLRFRNRAVVRRADSYRDSGRFAEAAESYAQAYAVRPDRADLCLQLANMLTELREFDLAEEAYREAQAKAPGDGLVALHFGHMLELAGRPTEARKAYLESARHIPDHPHLAPAIGRTAESLDVGGAS